MGIYRFHEAYDVINMRQMYGLQIDDKVAKWSSENTKSEIGDILVELACEIQQEAD